MRIRSIKPEFISDEEVASWPPFSRLAYLYMWLEADDCGRIRANPSYLGSVLFPFDKKLNMEAILEPIISSGKLIVWNALGGTWGILPNMMIHQKIDRPNATSKIPPPPPDVRRAAEDYITNHHGMLDECSTNVRRMFDASRARALEQGAGSREQGAGSRGDGGSGLGSPEVKRLHAGLVSTGKFPRLTVEGVAQGVRDWPGWEKRIDDLVLEAKNLPDPTVASPLLWISKVLGRLVSPAGYPKKNKEARSLVDAGEDGGGMVVVR